MRKHSKGFTIVELAVVIAIIALIISTTVAVGVTRIEAQKLRTTDNRMAFLVRAIDSYIEMYGHLPCPADGALASTDDDFGWGLGTNGLDGCEAANLLDSDEVVAGAVPVINLGVDPRAAIDGWDNKITYAVDSILTTTSGFESNGRIVILNKRSSASPVTIEEGAAYVLISHGPNGHGAWRAKAASSRLDTGIADDTDEGENAHIDDPGNFDNEFVQNFFVTGFDDIVIYKTKWQLE